MDVFYLAPYVYIYCPNCLIFVHHMHKQLDRDMLICIKCKDTAYLLRLHEYTIFIDRGTIKKEEHEHVTIYTVDDCFSIIVSKGSRYAIMHEGL